MQIIKYPDSFEFRNPGLMRVPVEEAKKGGNSDCRNRNLQKIFQFIGAGEQAGSGIPKIYQNWSQQHWKLPKIIEKYEPEQTCFELRMENLLSPESLDLLINIFGDSFKELSEFERLILVIAEAEKSVDHRSLKNISSEHPADISKYLNNLVKKGFLISKGRGRGTFYSVNFNSPVYDENSPVCDENSPVCDEELQIAQIAHQKQKLSKDKIMDLIIKLCLIRSQSIKRLSSLLQRKEKYISEELINPLVKAGKLNYLYPNEINHPRQAYIVIKGKQV